MPFATGAGPLANPAFTRVNAYLGNLKTALTGTYHAFQFEKYAARYLAEPNIGSITDSTLVAF